MCSLGWKLAFRNREIDSISGLVSLFRGAHTTALCFSEWSRGGYAVERESETLTRLMYKHMDLEATEPRDRVYGLLSLSKERREGRIRPDYGLSVQEVFLSAFVQHVQLYEDLNFALDVSLNSGTPGKKLAQHFLDNSWLQSWANHRQTFRHRSSYCSAGLVPCMPTALSVRSNIMFAHGFQCDALLSLDHLWQPGYHTLSWSLQWRVLVALLPELAELDQTGISRLSDRALMIFSQVINTDPATTMHGLNYWWRKAVEEASSTQLAELELTEEFIFNLSPATRSVFASLMASVVLSTRNGCIGSMPKGAVVKGDEVWIIFGCNKPLVLRPFGEYYILVGSAGIHGYMYGEAMGGPDVKGPYKAGDTCNGSTVREIKIW